MCLLPDKIRTLFKKTISESSPQMQALFFEHCIQNILADIGKGSSHGFKIMIQILLWDKPEIALVDLKKMNDLTIGKLSVMHFHFYSILIQLLLIKVDAVGVLLSSGPLDRLAWLISAEDWKVL